MKKGLLLLIVFILFACKTEDSENGGAVDVGENDVITVFPDIVYEDKVSDPSNDVDLLVEDLPALSKYRTLFGPLEQDVAKISEEEARLLLSEVRVLPYVDKDIVYSQEIDDFFSYLESEKGFAFPTDKEIAFYSEAWLNAQPGDVQSIGQSQWVAYALSCYYIVEIDKIGENGGFFVGFVNVQDGQTLFYEEIGGSEPIESPEIDTPSDDSSLLVEDNVELFADMIVEKFVADLSLGFYYNLVFNLEDNEVVVVLEEFFKKEFLVFNKLLLKNENILYTIRVTGSNLDLDREFSALSSNVFGQTLTYIDRNSLYYSCWSL
ncbi:MAG: hypothetical protein JXR63_04340 [Spirochaetales bacterium]|nr:hypothetical protein [Spirochaetales bacterium]